VETSYLCDGPLSHPSNVFRVGRAPIIHWFTFVKTLQHPTNNDENQEQPQEQFWTIEK
jgi:hypothetical protein